MIGMLGLSVEIYLNSTRDGADVFLLPCGATALSGVNRSHADLRASWPNELSATEKKG